MNVNTISATCPAVLRAAGQHQTTAGLLWVPPGYTANFGGTVQPIQRHPFVIHSFDVQNRSGGTASMGIGYRLANRIWVAGRLSADGATFTDLTSSAQSAIATMTLQVAGADQTGFAIGCKDKFDWVSVNITTAETDNDAGNEIDHDVYYSQGGSWSSALGSAAPVVLTNDFYKAGAVWTAAVKNFVWQAPTDWTPSVSLGGVPNDYYWLWFSSADREANDVAAVATGIEIGRGLFRAGWSNNAGYATVPNINLYHPEADGVVAYFSTANAGNAAYVETLLR